MDSTTTVSLTERVYGLIQEKDWAEAIALLSELLEDCGPPSSKPLLSLLGYCQYAAEEYQDAASTYQKVCDLCPKSAEFQLYLAQSLAKAGATEDANRVVVALEEEEGLLSDELTSSLVRVKLAITADSGDLATARKMVNSILGSDQDSENLVLASAIAFRQELYEEAYEALSGYSRALDAVGFRPDLAYNMAICSFKLKDYDSAMEVVTDAIDHAYEDHPELLSHHHHQSADGNPVTDPSYLAVIQQSRLMECFNLKASIEYDSGDKVAAARTLGDMPAILEEDKDAVTLHNEAIICDVGGGDLDGCFKKLQHLISNPSYPPETFANILLQYVQNGYEDLAATLLADNTDLTYELLSEELYSFLDASLLAATSPDEALTRFDVLGKDIAKRIRKASKLVGEAENEGDDDALATAHAQLDDAMKSYPPVLMAMAKIHWEKKDYEAVERLLRGSAEFCPDGKACATNLAHAYFMQGKHVEAAICFEPLVQGALTGGSGDESVVLDIPPVVLANLCVSFILSDQNEKAEALMDLVERAEEAVMALNSHAGHKDKPLLHLSTINLVIGTLYCQKSNFDFGISTICKSLEPFEQRLSSDTWYYCKTCLLALLDKLSKQMVTVADDVTSQIIRMLDAVVKHGKNIPSSGGGDEYAYVPSSSNSAIATEARKLKLAFLRLA